MTTLSDMCTRALRLRPGIKQPYASSPDGAERTHVATHKPFPGVELSSRKLLLRVVGPFGWRGCNTRAPT
eukprot:3792537-Alexandrium_andersonii.AAC.1